MPKAKAKSKKSGHGGELRGVHWYVVDKDGQVRHVEEKPQEIREVKSSGRVVNHSSKRKRVRKAS